MKKSGILVVISVFFFSFFAIPVMGQLPNPADIAKQAEEAKKKAEAEAAQAAEAAAQAKAQMFQRVLYMNFNSTSVASGSQATLDEILNGLDNVKSRIETAPPGTVLLIEGHADSVGDEAYNMTLSVNRANAIRSMILDQGVIEASMITVVGKGESEPMDESDQAKNRRVELKLDYKQ